MADIRLGDESFLEWISQSTRSKSLTAPFVVVSSVDDLPTLRSVFHLGAEDYLAKPFSPRELAARAELARLLQALDRADEARRHFDACLELALAEV